MTIDFFPAIIEEGGPGSGNTGHSGRPGEVGGSAPGTSGKKSLTPKQKGALTAIGNVMTADLRPRDIKHLEFKRYTNYIQIQDIDGAVGNVAGSISAKELQDYSHQYQEATLNDIEVFLKDNGAKRLTPKKSPYYPSVYDSKEPAQFFPTTIEGGINRIAKDTDILGLILAMANDDELQEIGAPKLRIKKDKVTQKYRWFAWPACTAFMNRDGQIDSMRLFDNFIRRIEETHIWPFLTFFHLGSNFRMGEADFVARDGVAYLVSGLFDDTQLARATIKSLSEDTDHYWGTSIQYTPLGEPKVLRRGKEKIPVYEDGYHIEVSILPEQAASSFFTSIPVSQETTKGVTK